MTLSLTQKRAVQSLAVGLRSLKPEVWLSSKGYVQDIEGNLVSGVRREFFETDLAKGDGNELETKFKAAHSSSALVVNTFAPFKNCPAALDILGHTDFENLVFEAKCPTGLRGGRHPHLDLLAQGAAGVVGVESKCTEHLQGKSWSPEKPPFSPAYFDQIHDERRDGRWFSAMEEISRAPAAFKRLDVAQLVKHALGLARVFKGRRAILLYLFWEPVDADQFDEFGVHRSEIALFTGMVRGGFPEFMAGTYNQLWTGWERLGNPDWLPNHVANLRSRYAVRINGPEIA